MAIKARISIMALLAGALFLTSGTVVAGAATTPSQASQNAFVKKVDASEITAVPDKVIAALERNKKFLRGETARRVNLKFAPDLRFRADERFDEAERIEKLLRTPAVQRDLAPDSQDSEE